MPGRSDFADDRGRAPGRSAAANAALAEHVGDFGAAFVTISLITVRTLGAGSVVALLVSAQLVISIVIDRFGWFGVHQIGISANRLIGLGLVVAGTVLITRA